MSITSDDERSFKPRRIRSKHRWRLISRLAIGDATVTELASETSLRVPHASAEISRMRDDGLVSSDLPRGSRGSKIRLTEKGWGTLQEDEWSKVMALPELSSEQDGCCVIFRDEENLLLCFLSQPDEPMISIPNRPPLSSEGMSLSTRNHGVSWNWAVLSERSPRWFDIANMEVLDAPPQLADPESIEAYVDKRSVVGVIRARLLEHEKITTVSPGVWFTPPASKPPAPLDEPTYHRGPWLLGSSHINAPHIRPTQPVAALISERLPRSVLLRSAKSNALVIADLGGLGLGGRKYPLRALDHWIEGAHPRLTGTERKRRLQSLRDRLLTSRRVKTEDSTLRRFRRDWGGAEFSTDESVIRLIDLRGLGKSAIESLIRWSLEVDELPLVLEIGSDFPNDLLNRIASSSNLRLVLMNELIDQFTDSDRIEVDRIRTLPWLKFSTKSGKELPVRLLEEAKVATSVQELEQPSISPWDVLSLPVEHEFQPTQLEGDLVSIVGSALSQFPDGDEEWANQMEARYPLAAWIASPQWARWPRWQRLSNRLDPEWLALLDMDYLPIDRISELADLAPDSVLKVYASKITTKLREDPDNLLRSWPAIDPAQASRGAAWVASQFIQNSAWLPEESHKDLIEWGIEAWLSEPPRDSVDALVGVSWLLRHCEKSNSEVEKMILRIRDRGLQLPEGHKLNTWSRLYNHAMGSSEADMDSFQTIRRDLPLGWWAPISSQILLRLLEEETLEELLVHESPWCATILRPIGEQCEAPGLSSISHPGCHPELLQTLQSRLRGIPETTVEQRDLNQLRDLIEALKSARDKSPPISGRTHDLVGWLAQPVERWPDFTIEIMMEGDSSVAERLVLRRSGFHPELL